MKRSFTALFLAGTLTLSLAGCSVGQAPQVTPTPDVTPEITAAPGATSPDPAPRTLPGEGRSWTEDGRYRADGRGTVLDPDYPNGFRSREPMLKQAEDAARDTAEQAGEALERAGEKITQAVK